MNGGKEQQRHAAVCVCVTELTEAGTVLIREKRDGVKKASS